MEPGAAHALEGLGYAKNADGIYEKDKVDELLKKMGETEPSAERDQISKDIQAIVAEDLTIIYLVDPQWHVALSDRVSDYVPYCCDYYCVNADLGL